MQLPILAVLPLAARAVNIVSSNDDGWAEANIRALYNSLTDDGHSVVLSGPADNQSGKGSLDTDPHDRFLPCEYNSCPAGSGPTGHNATNPRLNWVNSHPATSMRYGIDEFAHKFFDGEAPALAVTGPNVGSNLGLSVFFSGTAGAATYAAHEAGIPALAFSGANSTAMAWDTSSEYPLSSRVYAELATRVTDRVIEAGTPYLPEDVWLNVNFPKVNEEECSDPDDVKFVLSRIFFSMEKNDVETCGGKQLPNELSVVLKDGCYASISVGIAETKRDANATIQGVILDKLGDLVTCLPGQD